MSRFIPQSASTRYFATQDYMANAGQINFHRVAIKDVKSRLGSSCTYLSHLVSPNKKQEVQTTLEGKKVTKLISPVYFLAHLIINGEKRIVRVNTGVEAQDLVAENYKALVTQLSDYVTGKANI